MPKNQRGSSNVGLGYGPSKGGPLPGQVRECRCTRPLGVPAGDYTGRRSCVICGKYIEGVPVPRPPRRDTLGRLNHKG